MLQPRPRRSCPGTPALLWQQARKGKIKTQIPAWIQRNPSARLRRAQHQTRGLCWEGEEEHGSCDIGSALYFFFFPLKPAKGCLALKYPGIHSPGRCFQNTSFSRILPSKSELVKAEEENHLPQCHGPAAVCPGGELWLCPAASRNGAGSARSDAGSSRSDPGSSRSDAGSPAPSCKEAARVVLPASTPRSCWWGVGGF